MSKPYYEARSVIDAPYTEREQKLIETLEVALSDDVHHECRERLKDAVDELTKADESRLRGAPEAEVNLVKAKRTLEIVADPSRSRRRRATARANGTQRCATSAT